MKVQECMTRDVKMLTPDQTIQEAAQCMAECDVGAVPVGNDERLLGIVTDRDIAVRAICHGKGPDTKVQDVMTKEIKYCFEDEEIEHVAQNMGDIQVRRLPVMNRQKRLVGILSLGDIAIGNTDRETVGDTLGGISRHGGERSQSNVDARH